MTHAAQACIFVHIVRPRCIHARIIYNPLELFPFACCEWRQHTASSCGALLSLQICLLPLFGASTFFFLQYLVGT